MPKDVSQVFIREGVVTFITRRIKVLQSKRILFKDKRTFTLRKHYLKPMLIDYFEENLSLIFPNQSLEWYSKHKDFFQEFCFSSEEPYFIATRYGINLLQEGSTLIKKMLNGFISLYQDDLM